MKRQVATLAIVLLPLASAVAWADTSGDWDRGYGHMMWAGGFGMLGALMMLLFWGAFIVLIVVAVRWLTDKRSAGPDTSSDALKVLRSRFAQGEIDEEEFRRRKAALDE
ncbi:MULTISPECIES: SHOCT domain-containing protein [unclassified Leisingera]|uniref:SHOCT domain-containing protein n=1 Tax=unclassified Leisingera TaxID=2614906 RepID=UPI001FFC937B|nr:MULTISPECIES: SHOCT domain-containing protein [unclassified Leisingera]